MIIEDAVRTLMVGELAGSVDAGAAAGTCLIKENGGTTVATITLADPAFAAGAAGVQSISGTPSDTSADNNGDFTSNAGTAEFRDSDNNLKFTLSVTGPTLNNGELIIDRDTVTAGDTVTITTCTLTQPAS